MRNRIDFVVVTIKHLLFVLQQPHSFDWMMGLNCGISQIVVASYVINYFLIDRHEIMSHMTCHGHLVG